MINYIKDRKRLMKIMVASTIFFIAGILASQFYDEFRSKEFFGCKNLPLEATDKIDSKIFYLMKEEKYQEVVNFGNKYLKDDGLWYCDPYFWNQRAKAFYNLGDCVQSQIASLHAIYVAPAEANKPEKEYYDFVRNSNICGN